MNTISEKTQNNTRGVLTNGMYHPGTQHEGILNRVNLSYTCTSKLKSRMRLLNIGADIHSKAATMQDALKDANRQYTEIYVDACTKLNIEPKCFEDFLINGIC